MSVDQSVLAAQMLTQMALVQGTITTIGNLQDASPVVLQTVYAAVANALAPFDAAIAAYEDDVDSTSVGGVVVGVDAPTMALDLLTQATDLEQEARLVVARSYLARVGSNVKNAPG